MGAPRQAARFLLYKDFLLVIEGTISKSAPKGLIELVESRKEEGSLETSTTLLPSISSY